MTDQSWVTGYSELLATFPDRDLEPRVQAVRGQVYRRELDHLSDERWLYAVREAIRNERWFPTVAALLDYADSAGAPPRPVAGLLEAPVRTEEEREAAREVARKALDKIKAICNTIQPERPRTAQPSHDPSEPLVISDEKLDRAKALALKIVREA